MLLKDVKGVGSKTFDLLNINEVFTIHDLLFRFPKNYLIFENNPEHLFDSINVYVEGIVDSKVSMFRYRGKAFSFSFYMLINDRKVKMTYFTNLYSGIKVKEGMRIGVYGKYNKQDRYFSVKRVFTDDLGAKIETEYKYREILDSTISRIVNNAIRNYECEETLPLDIVNKYKLLGINEYLMKSHFPKTKDDIKEVLRRRKYEEFFWYSISFDLIRYKEKKISKELRVIDDSIYDTFKSNLNFGLTLDQDITIRNIMSDIKDLYPMNRLVQGDVGSGKTVVAQAACLLEIKAGYQAAVMAPTEVLANQHLISFRNALSKYGVTVELLTGSTKQKDKDDILYRLLAGRIDLIIGTHSLIYDNVLFKKLGLVIIDEQHRFGVKQRLKLVDKYSGVDSLFLSATPIPRTLGLTFFKDLSISSIKTMPNDRKGIITKIIPNSKIDLLMKSIKNHLDMGEQAFVVVPLVEENDSDIISVDECENLFKSYFDNYSIGKIHGKMKSKDKDLAISMFKSGSTNILISTTVIEVGIDIPNATMMIIMDADRFGLSTLHQLRGRVGRGSKESYCMLVTRNPENDRLEALENNPDGFSIAEIDFKLRGPGDYLGESQSGYSLGLDFVNFTDDLNILKCAKEDSTIYLPKLLNKEVSSETFDQILELNKNKITKIN